METKSLKLFKILSTLVMIITTIFVVCIFNWLYSVTKDNIISVWKNKTESLGHKVDLYMRLPADAVSFSALTLNEMLTENKENKFVQNYLVEETKIYSRFIPENISGVYAFYNKEYLDGSGWIPDSDYQPKERPWYTAALQGKGKLILSDPYFNFQTNTVMMSVCELLSDNESVVSMDIFLDGFQKIIQKFSENRDVISSFLINKKGFVLAHSDENMLGKNFFESESSIKDALFERIQNNGKKLSEDCYFIQNESIFIYNPYKDLFLVVELDDKELFSSLFPVYMASSLFIAAIIIIYIFIFIKMSRKYDEAEKLYNEVQGMYLLFSKE